MTRTIKNLILLAIFLGLSSCIEVKFRDSQPAGISALKEVPNSIWGEYRNEDGDTLILTSRTFSLMNRESGCSQLTEFDSLTDRIQIKAWKNYLFFNMNEDSLWTVALIRMNEDNSFNFSLIDAEDEDVLDFVSSTTQMTTHFSEDGEPIVYAVEPDHAQLEKLIEGNAFTISYFFKKLP